MHNATNAKIAAKYEPMLELIEKDSDGYWAYAEAGYVFATTGCATLREDTQAALVKNIRTLEVDERPTNFLADVVAPAAPAASLTVRAVAEKFVYTVTLPNGEQQHVVSARNKYTHFVIAANRGEATFFISSKHNSLVDAQRAQAATNASESLIVEVTPL